MTHLAPPPSTGAGRRARRWAMVAATLAAVATAVALPQVVPAGHPLALADGGSGVDRVERVPGSAPSDALVITGDDGQAVAANFAGDGHSAQRAVRSLWWRWTAPASGSFRFSTHGTE